MSEFVKAEPLSGNSLESFIVRGDLSVLSPDDKAKHYLWVCERVGLDAATKPFEYIKLNGREVLYCKKEGTDQLRKIHTVAISITNRERIDDVYVVTAKAIMPDGRTDESQGAVTISGLKGDNLANAIMKAETKAKRRVTLSIVGLGMLDESELETIQPDKFAQLREFQSQKDDHVKSVNLVKEVLGVKNSDWTTTDPLPLKILRALPKTLHHLEGVSLQDMSIDDLLAVQEMGDKAYKSWSAYSHKDESLMKVLRSIIEESRALVMQKDQVPA